MAKGALERGVIIECEHLTAEYYNPTHQIKQGLFCLYFSRPSRKLVKALRAVTLNLQCRDARELSLISGRCYRRYSSSTTRYDSYDQLSPY